MQKSRRRKGKWLRKRRKKKNKTVGAPLVGAQKNNPPQWTEDEYFIIPIKKSKVIDEGKKL